MRGLKISGRGKRAGAGEQREIPMGRSSRAKPFRHRTLRTRNGRDGSPEVECPSCESWVSVATWWAHSCPKPITGNPG